MYPKAPLSADKLFELIQQQFTGIADHRPMNVEIPLADALMSGFALFSLKDPSLLAFDGRRTSDSNLNKIYHIGRVPSDTQMRKILDGVAPEKLRPVFKCLVNHLEDTGILEQMSYMDGHYLLSVDGTGYFSSKQIHCDSCLQKVNRKTGEITYSHQILGAALVHPEQKTVIPLAPEPIIKQDGTRKNDCERNAAKRLLTAVRQDYPDMPLIVIEDALSANAPHIRELIRHDLRYILGVKQGDHAFLFEQIEQSCATGTIQKLEIVEKGTVHRFEWVNEVPLNASNPDLLVNFLAYWEVGKKKPQHFTWITDFALNPDTVYPIMRGGRARWKIENETFNTLKNQGYQFEHNFGHGECFLTTVFAMVMMLAFAVDQAQQLACPLFQAAWEKRRTKRALWEKMRALFETLEFASMHDILSAIAFGYRVEGLVINDSS
jgi:hypothetical protein